MDTTLLERINDLEETIVLLKQLNEKVKNNPNWRDFVDEMLISYEHTLEVVQEQYFNSPEYLEFAPNYLHVNRPVHAALVLR